MNNKPVSFSKVKIIDHIWRERIKTLEKVTLFDVLEKCEETGRIANFKKAASGAGEYEGYFYNDSDVYKILEGIGYTLSQLKNREMEAAADTIIEIIASAQQDDGYINTFFTLSKDKERWTDMSMHETYCIGHLIEAGISYYHGTGKRRLLDVAIAAADHLVDMFGEGKSHWVPGHQEIELALIKLYDETGNTEYMKLAGFFLGERGTGVGKGYSWDRDDWGKGYNQDDVPVTEMERIVGHAVRAVYMLMGMADYSAVSGDQKYLPALLRVWDNTVNRNMYITGAIGSSAENEGFSFDYDLPNKTGYGETCASVAIAMWASRMNILFDEASYIDVLERAIYNGCLAGYSKNGKRFFYVNPLASDGDHHRKEWFSCSCCPAQIARFIPSIGGYIYTHAPGMATVNLYMASEAEIDGEFCIVQQTEFPYDGQVRIKLYPKTDGLAYKVRLRIPEYAASFSVLLNDKETDFRYERGYAIFEREWNRDDELILDMDMPVRRIFANTLVTEDAGLLALSRGPIVFAFEEDDNPDFDNIRADEGDVLVCGGIFDEGLGKTICVKVLGKNGVFTAIPYYLWDNREAGRMRVWIETDMEEEFKDKLYKQV